MSIQEKQAQLLYRLRKMDELELFDYLYERAFNNYIPDTTLQQDKNIFSECQSTLWVAFTCGNNGIQLKVDSNALIVRSCTMLMLDIFDGENAENIASCQIDFWDDACFDRLISRRTRQGLNSLMQYIKEMYSHHINNLLSKKGS